MIANKTMKRWRREVGVMANDAALGKFATAAGKQGAGTLPELLVEGALVRRGLEYRTQVELGFTRVDHMVMNADGTGWIALFEDGDYWHKDFAGHDYGKGQQLIGCEVEGLPVTGVVRMLESDLKTDLDWVVDRAVAGEQVRTLS